MAFGHSDALIHINWTNLRGLPLPWQLQAALSGLSLEGTQADWLALAVVCALKLCRW